MAACLGGIMRSTVALAVTILEGTDNIEFLLPILIVINMAKMTADFFNIGMYETALEVSLVLML